MAEKKKTTKKKVDGGVSFIKEGTNEIVGDDLRIDKTTEPYPQFVVEDSIIQDVIANRYDELTFEILRFLRGKCQVSEFIIAEELDIEIHTVRNIMYRLLKDHVATFVRKKDKIKGWYVCYWDFNEPIIPHVRDKIISEMIDTMQKRLKKEKGNFFYMCHNACIRMDFEKAMDFQFKCPECGELMHEQDNARTISFLTKRIEELKNDQL